MLNPLRDPPPRAFVRLAAGLLLLIAAALAAAVIYFRPTFGFVRGSTAPLGAPPSPTSVAATPSTAPSQWVNSVTVPPPIATGSAPDAGPELLSRSIPSPYELFAGCTGGHGVFIIEIRVTTTGQVTQAKMLRGPGCAAAEQRMLAAVRSWRYSPARIQGKAVEATVTLSVSPGG